MNILERVNKWGGSGYSAEYLNINEIKKEISLKKMYEDYLKVAEEMTALAKKMEEMVRDNASREAARLEAEPALKEEVKAMSLVPDSWEELEEIGGAYINIDSGVSLLNWCSTIAKNKNVWPTTSLAEACLAQSQLAQLRNATWANDNGWDPDWDSECQDKYAILPRGYKGFEVYRTNGTCRFLSFSTAEIAKEFIKKHESLMQVARQLL